MYTSILNEKYIFSIKEGQTILAAAQEANIFWPHSCKNGRCNNCKCRIMGGTSSLVFQELGLSLDEKNDGWILGCARSAKSNLILTIDDFQNKKLPRSKLTPCKINSLELLSPSTLKVSLRFPKTTQFDFIPGQYVEIIGHYGIKRCYSIANSNFMDNIIELHIRYINNGIMSDYWFNSAKVNDLLRIEGPMGTFGLNSNHDGGLIFLATGTGIAPIKSILESISFLPENNRPKFISVYWGNRTITDMYFDIFSLPNVDLFIPVLSRPNTPWEGAIGYVQDEVIRRKISFKNTEVYACGSPLMINNAKEKFINAGLPISKFYSDAFYSSN